MDGYVIVPAEEFDIKKLEIGEVQCFKREYIDYQARSIRYDGKKLILKGNDKECCCFEVKQFHRQNKYFSRFSTNESLRDAFQKISQAVSPDCLDPIWKDEWIHSRVDLTFTGKQILFEPLWEIHDVYIYQALIKIRHRNIRLSDIQEPKQEFIILSIDEFEFEKINIGEEKVDSVGKPYFPVQYEGKTFLLKESNQSPSREAPTTLLKNMRKYLREHPEKSMTITGIIFRKIESDEYQGPDLLSEIQGVHA